MIAKLVAKGGFIVEKENKIKLQNVIWKGGAINADVVAQPAAVIAKMAGFTIPDNVQFFIVPESGYGKDYPFSGEKMTVTMALYRAKNINEAIKLTNAIQSYQGILIGHLLDLSLPFI